MYNIIFLAVSDAAPVLHKTVNIGRIEASGGSPDEYEVTEEAETLMTIDRSTIQSNAELFYHYTLSWKPSAGTVEDLVLYDSIEDKTDSRFAGAPVSAAVEISRLGTKTLEPVTAEVWVRTDTPSDDDTAVGAYGTGWSLAGTITTDENGEGVLEPLPEGTLEIAFRFLEARFDKKDTVKAYINMVHAGRPENKGDEKTLTNTMSASYRLRGTDEVLKDECLDTTTVEILYNDKFYVPVTGGEGVKYLYSLALTLFGLVGLILVMRQRKAEGV